MAVNGGGYSAAVNAVAGNRPVRIGLLMLSLLVLVGCTRPANPPLPSPDAVVAQIVDALTIGNMRQLPLTTDATTVQASYQAATGDMDGYLPSVTADAAQVNPKAGTATVQLHQTYTFDAATWAYASSAELRWSNDAWQVNWTPSIVHPALTATTRLVHYRQPAIRADILDLAGNPIVTARPVYQVGIDKTKVDAGQLEASARALAALVGVDANSYFAQVTAAGPQAFVVAITFRAGQVPEGVDQIPGGMTLAADLPLAPTASFALGVLGSVGEASTQEVSASNGAIQAGDLVGKSGIQKSMDAQLRGTAGHTVMLLDRRPVASPTENAPSADASGIGSASGSSNATSAAPASESANGTSSDSVGAVSTPATPPPTTTKQTLFHTDPVNGTPVRLSLNVDLQTKAESVLAGVNGVASLVMIDLGGGGIVAAANSPAAGANSFAMAGQYAPGSTFKIPSSLALLRHGLTPDSPINCPPSVNVNGKVFTNYSGYPAGATGQIPLRMALANSCNTAFVGASMTFGATDLADAAASLGVGKDYDIGVDSFFGQVPTSADPATRAADTIGQGEVLASPMAMAAEAASVAVGHTVVPWIIQGRQPAATATPISAQEADQLQTLMHGVVYDGPLMPQMRGILQGGKTGTAEFDASGGLDTHGWLIGYTDRYAISIMLFNEQRGSAGAIPLAQAMLG